LFYMRAPELLAYALCLLGQLNDIVSISDVTESDDSMVKV